MQGNFNHPYRRPATDKAFELNITNDATIGQKNGHHIKSGRPREFVAPKNKIMAPQWGQKATTLAPEEGIMVPKAATLVPKEN